MVLHEIAARIVRGQPIGRLRVNESAAWPAKLRMLLQCAAGWYLAGNDDDAHAILDEASHDMFAARTPASVRTKLAVRYVKTLAYAPLSVALGRLEQIFQDLRGIELTGSTNKYYSLNPLMLIETTVRAVVSDEFTIGPLVRAWLDADELSIRRRIRDDLKIVLMNQGL
jgi:hypothetical protein